MCAKSLSISSLHISNLSVMKQTGTQAVQTRTGLFLIAVKSVFVSQTYKALLALHKYRYGRVTNRLVQDTRSN